MRPIFSRDEWRFVVRTTRAGMSFGLLTAAALLWAALWSYDPADPSPYSATWRSAENWLGEPGAAVADTLIRFIGLSAYAFGALVAIWALRVFVGAIPENAHRKLLAAPFALAAIAAVASSQDAVAPVGGGLGGVIGDYLFGVFAYGLPFTGEKLQLVVAAIAFLILAIVLGFYAAGVALFDAIDLGRLGGRHLARARALSAEWSRGEGRRQLGLALGALVAVVDFLAKTASALAGGRRLVAAGPEPLRSAPAAPRDDWDGVVWRGRAATDSEPEPGFSRAVPDAPPAPSWDAPTRSFTAFGDAPATKPTIDEPIEPGFSASAEGGDRAEDAATADETGVADRAGAEDAEPVDASGDAASAEASEPTVEDAPADDGGFEGDWIEDEGYAPPPLDLLAEPESARLASADVERMLAEQADRLQRVLTEYGVRGEIIHVNPGPVVSQYELEPAPGLKASRVVGLADDIARSMSAVAARVSTVPGRNIIGIELPNARRETVLLREVLEDRAYEESDARLPIALGKDIGGGPVVVDLARMPHLLIAGTTGSGKSVAINTLILSLLYRLGPEDARLILIDPKMLELSVYNDIPHLLSPVVTDPKKAVSALRWVVREMESRYEKMARLNVRSLESYNERVAEAAARGEPLERRVQVGFDDDTGAPIYETQTSPAERLPLIVVVIDEMADLMMVAGKEIEQCIQRLAQMARASGIHLVMATQRPSVDVITGVIKANFPIRVSFQVTSKIDSRTIIGEGGAEQLLGKGDMLYAAGGGRLQRVHGPFVSDLEVEAVAAHLRARGAPSDPVDFDANEAASAAFAGLEDADGLDEIGADDALYAEAVAIVARERRASTSFIQRRLQIGYNRAARMIELMESQGVVSPANHAGKREVLAPKPGDAAP